MSNIFYINALTLIGALIGSSYLIINWKIIKSPAIRTVFIATYILLFIYISLLTIEWAGITNQFDALENLAGAMIPVLWILIFVILIDFLNHKELARKEERMKLALEGAALGTWDWNIITGKVIFNKRWANMLGYELVELKPDISTWEKLIHPTDLDEVKKNLDEHLSGKTEFYQAELRMQHKSGEWVWILGRGKVMERNNEGIPTRAAGTHLDITERKQMQEELQLKNEEYLTANEELTESIDRVKEINILHEEAIEKAEQSDKLKTAFLANLSHEIRTPMNGILGFSDLLSNQNLSHETQEKYINLIQRSGKRMLSLINDLVDISKIEAGQISINPKPTKLNEMMQRLHSFFQPKAVECNLNLSLDEYDSCEEIIIDVDDLRLEQILSNLISNAIKYTKVGKIEFGYKILGKEIYFWVKDTGIGIPKDKHEIIFERFRQADDRAFKGEEGSGLGLSISKALVELMQGTIWIESKVGEGSTFSFTIPYISSANMDEDKDFTPILATSINKKTIMIVEDDEVSFMLLNELLPAEKFNIIHATNGNEAINIFFTRNDINAIFMDIKMPVLNGIDATIAIRKENKDIPIIAQTAYASNEEREKIINAGCTTVITKPIDRKELKEVIDAIFS